MLQRLKQIQIPLGLATLCGGLVACVAPDPQPGEDQASDELTAPAVSVGKHAKCELLYYSDVCNPDCPSIVVAQLDQKLVGGLYPAFSKTLGTPDLPFTGSALASPKSYSTGEVSKRDGYFDLAILGAPGTGFQIGSEAEISLSRLTLDKFVIAGDLRSKASFVYLGQSYNNLEMLCYLTAP